MLKLLENYKEYKSDLSSSQLDRIRQLAKGQKPESLFISWTDRRVKPNLFTKSEPGSLFELQKFRLAKTPLNLSVAVTKKINIIPRIGTLMNFDHKVPPKLAI